MLRHLPDPDEQPQDPNGRSVLDILQALVFASEMKSAMGLLAMELALKNLRRVREEIDQHQPILPWERRSCAD